MKKKLLLLSLAAGLSLATSAGGAVVGRPVPYCGYTLCITPGQTTACRCTLDSQQPGAPANCQTWEGICWGGFPP